MKTEKLADWWRHCERWEDMIFFLFALLLLTVSQTSQLAQPKGFTDDPYVDDEKFIEKGELALTVSDIFNIS